MSENTTAVVAAPAADASVVEAFGIAPAALAESRALQQRIDRKFLLSMARLAQLLDRLIAEHLLLLAGHAAWARYESVYFDSADRDLYHAHRRGRLPRYKVRVRHHLDRELTFLEVKRKERGGRTVKFRHALPFGQRDLGTPERLFIERHAPLDPNAFVPAVTVSFLRLTLLGRIANERITLDRDVTIADGAHVIRLPPVVIAEVKQPRFVNHTGAVAALKGTHAREMALSKYCLGTFLSTPVSDNVFKPLLRAITRMSA